MRRRKPNSSPIFEELEPRLLFSADGLGVLAAHALPDEQTLPPLEITLEPDVINATVDPGFTPQPNLAPLDTHDLEELANLALTQTTAAEGAETGLSAAKTAAQASAWSPQSETRQELIFVDAETPDYQQLIDTITADAQAGHYTVIVLEADRDGVEQISATLANYEAVDAIHLVSHGSAGNIQLGSSLVNAGSLNDFSDSLATWKSALDSNADLLIYGCNLAGDEAGRQLARNIGALTGADVAASDDLTGNARLGGDWELEYQIGVIEASSFNAQLLQGWNGVLFEVTFTVDSVDEAPGDSIAQDALGRTTLRAAIMEANALGGSQVINLDPGTYALSITGTDEDLSETGDLDITSNITIVGTDARTTIIDAQSLDRVFDVFGAAGSVTISGVTIRGGDADTGAGIRVESGANLTLNDVELRDNHASGMGGGISTEGALTLERVTVSDNSGFEAGGVHVSPSGIATLTNVTLSGNTATSGDGGGLFNENNAVLRNVTITNNTANLAFGLGGGIVNEGPTLDIANSIVHGNSANDAAEISGNIQSQGHNIVGSTSGASGFHGTDDTSSDPLLGSLQLNNGTTRTHALAAGSVAIDPAGSVSPPVIDQRGVTRDAAPDIGAYEQANNSPTGAVTIDNTTPAQGDTLTASNTLADADGLSSPISYQWQRDGVDIGGAIGTTYTTIQADVGAAIRVVASYTDDLGTAESASSGATAAVTEVNDVPVIGNNAISMSQGQTVLLDSSNLSATDVDNADGSLIFNVSTVTNGWFALAADTATPISSFTQDDVTGGAIVFVHDGGELTAAYSVAAADGTDSSATASGTVTFSDTAAGVLWLSTDGNEGSSNGVPGLDTTGWNQGDILQQADPNFALGEATTDGTFSIAFNPGNFGTDANINGLHYVTNNVTLGAANVINLQPGDLLLTTGDSKTFNSNGAAPSADLAVNKEDIFYFRPDQAGDYSRGNFYQLLNDPFQDGAEVRGLSLVEQDVWVGDRWLTVGDLLLTRSGASEDNDIWLLETGALDPPDGSSYPAAQRLIEGDDAGVELDPKLFGLDILENDTSIGGLSYDAGTILVALDGNDSDGIGTSLQLATEHDVIALSVSRTSLGSGTGNAQVAATLLFEGDAVSGNDVNLDSSNEAIDAFSLTVNVSSGNMAPVLGNTMLAVDEGQTLTVSSAMLSASDTNDADSGLVFNVSSVSGGQFELSGASGVAVTSFNQAQVTAGNVLFVDDGDEVAPAFDVEVSDGMLADGPLGATINFNNVNDAPLNTVPGTQTVSEEITTAIAGVSIADTDAGVANLSTRLQVTAGTLNVVLAGSAGIAAGSNGSADLTVQGTQTDINNTLASLTYTGNTDVVGNAADTLTVTTNDGGNTGSGGARQAMDTVQIDISNVNDLPTGSVTIDNTMPVQGDILTASDTLADADGLTAPISYQWQRNGGDIGGATGASYTTTLADVGSAIRVVAGYTDDLGSIESVPSTGTAAVSSINDPPTDLTPNSFSINENINTTGGYSLGALLATDPDGGETFDYAIRPGGDAALFSIGGAGSDELLIDAGVLDFENKDTYTVTVRVTDSALNTYDELLTVNVSDLTDILVVDTTSAGADAPDRSSIAALLGNKGPDGKISLFEAIEAANADPNGATADEIHFQITDALVGGAHTITVASGGLPLISEAVIIDGSTDADYVDSPIIELSGASAGAGANGLTISGDGVTVRGLVINRFQGNGIHILGDNNRIESSYIGTDITGAIDQGNIELGVNIDNAAGNYIGGAGVGNVISGNGYSGIAITGVAADNNFIQGNLIGTNAGGSAAIANDEFGVYVGNSGPDNNSIGGTGAALRNIISGNNMGGVYIYDAGTTGNLIQGNYIGTDITGNSTIANGISSGHGGIFLTGGANNTTIGGTADNAGNLIAFNIGPGVKVNGPSTVGNAIQENSIHSNTGIGIDLRAGGNEIRVSPTVSSVIADGAGSVSITGNFNEAFFGIDSLTIEFFSNPGNAAEGRTYLGSDTLTTNIAGFASINSTLAATVAAGDYVTATVTDSSGNTSEFSAGQIATTSNNAPTGSVAIDNGAPAQGDTLTASNTLADADGLTGLISYQWQRGGVDISGATGTTYTTLQTDVGTAISVVASYTDDLGAPESVASAVTAAVTNVNDSPTGAVTIDNATPAEGDILTASNTLADADGLTPPIGYQWQRGGVDIGGATGTTYTTFQADVGAVISVVASYADDLGTPESVASAGTIAVTNVNNSPTGAVTIDNATPAEGDILTASNTLADADGLTPPISYQWQRGGVAISGATGTTYTTLQSDVGAVISVVASYTDDLGAPESVVSAGTIAVTNVNDSPTGAVTIDNATPAQGDILTASNTLADADGLTPPIGYQWQRGGVDISGATGTTYTTLQTDVGTAISVVASYTDDLGTPESVASAATAAVTNVNDSPTGAVTIDNTTPAPGDTLTASNTLLDADGLTGPINYQWQRDGVDITGATNRTYATTHEDVGKALSVVVSYIDNFGNEESIASVATMSVIDIAGNNALDDLSSAAEEVVASPSSATDETKSASNVVQNNALETEYFSIAANSAGDEPPSTLHSAAENSAEEAESAEDADDSSSSTMITTSIIDNDIFGDAARMLEGVEIGNIDNPLSNKINAKQIIKAIENLDPASNLVTQADVLLVENASVQAIEGFSLLGNSALQRDLDDFRKALNAENKTEQIVVGSSVAVTAGASLGYVVWLIRGGVLLSSVLTSLPAWRLIDPLPVLATELDNADDEEDDESLAAMLEREPETHLSDQQGKS